MDVLNCRWGINAQSNRELDLSSTWKVQPARYPFIESQSKRGDNAVIHKFFVNMINMRIFW